MNTASTKHTKTSVSFKIDKHVKKEFTKVCDEIGIPFSTFLNITIKNLIRTKRFVGEISYTPNINTLEEITLGEEDFIKGNLKSVTKEQFKKSLNAK